MAAVREGPPRRDISRWNDMCRSKEKHELGLFEHEIKFSIAGTWNVSMKVAGGWVCKVFRADYYSNLWGLSTILKCRPLFRQQAHGFFLSFAYSVLTYFLICCLMCSLRHRETWRVSADSAVLLCSILLLGANCPTSALPEGWDQLAATVARWVQGACSWESFLGQSRSSEGWEAPGHAPLSQQPSLTKFKDKII